MYDLRSGIYLGYAIQPRVALRALLMARFQAIYKPYAADVNSLGVGMFGLG